MAARTLLAGQTRRGTRDSTYLMCTFQCRPPARGNQNLGLVFEILSPGASFGVIGLRTDLPGSATEEETAHGPSGSE